MGLQHWSTTAIDNGTGDPNVYAAEGQSAASVNNALRGIMKSGAEYRKDNDGSLVAVAGGANLYSVTTNQAIVSLADPFTIAFTVDAANTGPATLSVNGLAAKSVRRKFGYQMGPSDFYPYAAFIYELTWIPSLDYFVITRPDIVKPGTYRAQADANIEHGWIICNGQALSRTDFAALFGVIGTTYGAGNGTTTFNVPDRRGRVGATLDDTVGRLATGLGTGAILGNAGGADVVTLTVAQMPSHNHGGTTGNGLGQALTTGNENTFHTHSGTTGSENQAHTHNFSGNTSNDSAGTPSLASFTDASHSHNVATSTSGIAPPGGPSSYLVPGSSTNTGVTDTRSTGLTIGSWVFNALAAHGHSYSGTTGGENAAHDHNFTTGFQSANHQHSVTVPDRSISSQGGGTAHTNVQPTIIETVMMKA